MASSENSTTGTNGPVSHAASSVHQVIDKAADGLRPAIEQVASGAHHAVESLAGSANHLSETLSATGRQLKARQSRLAASCCEQIRDRPVASLGIALGAGILLGWLLKLRGNPEN